MAIDRRLLGTLALLGFASGFPYGMLTGDPLRLWLLDGGVGLAALGMFSLVALPYSLKAVWSPLVDRWGIGVGRRRAWLAATPAAMAAGFAGLAAIDPAPGMAQAVILVAIVIAFFSASQDIAADAYRTERCDESHRGPGASAFVIGYRLAFVSSGWWVLELKGVAGWRGALLACAALMALLAVLALRRREPPPSPPVRLDELVVMPFRLLWSRFGMALLAVAVLAVSVRAADQMLGNVAVVFLKKAVAMGDADIGRLRSGFGLPVMILGSLAGAWMVQRWGLARALAVAVVLAAVSNAGYAVAAWAPQMPVVATAVLVEVWCSAVLGTAMVAWFMSLCEARCAATQYALLSSAPLLPGMVLVPFAGVWAAHLGWTWFFMATVLVAVPAVLALPWACRRGTTASSAAP